MINFCLLSKRSVIFYNDEVTFKKIHSNVNKGSLAKL